MTTKNRIEWKNIRILPIQHNRIEFADEVRRHFEEYKPDHVAVEYPATLKPQILRGVKRLPLLSVVHYEEKDGSFVYLVLEPTDGQIEAIRLALANEIPVHFIDRDTEGYPFDRTPTPDPYAVKKIGHFAYCQAFLKTQLNVVRSSVDKLRERTMAYHLQCLRAEGERILFVGGLYHLPGLLEMLDHQQTEVIGRRHRKGVALAHLHRDSSREVMTEMPFLAATYERLRSQAPADGLDRIQTNEKLIDVARENYWKKDKERLSHTQLRVLHQFARNYALITGGLVPSLYQLVVAARGADDDNFAYELWDAATDYPWQTGNPELPVIRLTGEDLFLDQKRIRFHRRLKSFRRRLVPVPGKKRSRETVPGEWKQDFAGLHICSYPPEDVVIEGYGRYLQKKAVEVKSEENIRVEPFSTTMLDGLDIRQTIRDWEQGKIYVKEKRPLQGKVGSVVLIFDPDLPDGDGDERFPWKVTWLGEHEQESDMAFYSTPAGEVMDGPGISRCQYGGFMLTYPPLRVYDIWRDPFFNRARHKPERLLMAAIDYSMEKHVAYVAADPPSGWCQSMAARLGKKIIYLPIGVFSPVTLKKIRQFHVLDGHHVRKYAPQYIS
jgi:hypothetical protein